MDPAHGSEVDGAILSLEDLARVVRVLDFAAFHAACAPAGAPCGRNDIAVLRFLLRHCRIARQKDFVEFGERRVVVGVESEGWERLIIYWM